jgi:hypothetical protein
MTKADHKPDPKTPEVGPSESPNEGDTNLDYLKEKMRERAATEVPKTEASGAATKHDTHLDTVAALEETKEAVNKVAEKLEQLSHQVAEENNKEKTS